MGKNRHVVVYASMLERDRLADGDRNPLTYYPRRDDFLVVRDDLGERLTVVERISWERAGGWGVPA